MAKPPDSTKTSCYQKLAGRTRERWPQLDGVTVRWHGQFAYIAGQLRDGNTLPLMRLQYTGSAPTYYQPTSCQGPRHWRAHAHIDVASRAHGMEPTQENKEFKYRRQLQERRRLYQIAHLPHAQRFEDLSTTALGQG